MKIGWSPFANKVNISPNTIVTLTQDGLNKAESQEGVGDLGQILGTLQFGGRNGSYSVRELSDRTGISEKRIEEVVRENRAYILIKSSVE
jgi:hypothetical protein